MSLTDVYFLTYYMHACSFMSNSFAISWTVALQLLLSMIFPARILERITFSRGLPDPGTAPHHLCFLHCRCDALPL